MRYTVQSLVISRTSSFSLPTVSLALALINLSSSMLIVLLYGTYSRACYTACVQQFKDAIYIYTYINISVVLLFLMSPRAPRFNGNLIILTSTVACPKIMRCACDNFIGWSLYPLITVSSHFYPNHVSTAEPRASGASDKYFGARNSAMQRGDVSYPRHYLHEVSIVTTCSIRLIKLHITISHVGMYICINMYEIFFYKISFKICCFPYMRPCSDACMFASGR